MCGSTRTTKPRLWVAHLKVAPPIIACSVKGSQGLRERLWVSASIRNLAAIQLGLVCRLEAQTLVAHNVWDVRLGDSWIASSQFNANTSYECPLPAPMLPPPPPTKIGSESQQGRTTTLNR